ncbi:MAG: hypothetical protein EB048_11640, partial [Gammaproteobacteria bacterium]|nr:hypothetical protein [Gammaproteobacteria bacterium]
PRDRLSFRRKSEDQNFLVNFPVGLKGGTFRLPKGLVSGQRLNQALRRVTVPAARIENFDRLPTPFRAVATDLETGEPVELARGDLVTSMRASLAAPGVFAPVEVDGRLLVDGGLANNLPVEIARSMGVDVLIVVDVGFPLRKRDTLDSVATISNQMLSILIRRGSDAQRRTLQAADILLAPQLGEASSFDFDIVPRAVALGEEAARAALDKLGALRLDEREYSDYLAARAALREGAPRVAEVQVAADSTRYERLLRAGFTDTASAEGLDAGLDRLYGRGNFESVDYRLRAGAKGDTLELSAKRNSWGPNYMRIGLNLEDDFNGNSSYNAAARFVLADIGREFSNWGEWRAGLRRVTGRSRLRIGDPLVPAVRDFDVREYFGRLSYDELDNRNFPRRGQYWVAEWRAEAPSLGSAQRSDVITVDWLAARSSGRNTGVLWSSFGTNIDSASRNIRTLFPLGGFLNLSALAPDSISGRHYAITRAMYYRQIG